MASETVQNKVPQTLTPELRPDVSNLVTEDDTPVDNVFSEKQQRMLTEPLYSSWSGPEGRRKFVAMANVALFYSVHETPYVPDMLLSLDVEVPADLWPKAHRSYFWWEYGKLPEVVVEVVSNREGGEDSDKLIGYARIGIPYYVIFDPEHLLADETLRVFRRHSLAYQPMDEPIWFAGVELGLRLWQGRFEEHENTWLRWVDANGQPIPTGAERAQREQEHADQQRERAEHERQRADHERQRADQERQRADQERQRADQERQRADQERQRAERLAEQLRRQGAEPEA